MDQDEPPPQDMSGAPLQPVPEFHGCSIVPAANGWIIDRRIGHTIVIEKIEGRDNVAHLLAQLSVLLGDPQ